MDTGTIGILGLAQTVVGGLVGYAIKSARQIRDDATKKIDLVHQDIAGRLDAIHKEVRETNGKVRVLESTTAAAEASVKQWNAATSEVRARCMGRFDSLDKDIRELRRGKETKHGE